MKVFKIIESAPFVILALMIIVSGCGKAGNGTSSTGVTVQSNPLAGSSAASLPIRMFDAFLGIPSAHAAVTSFTSFKMCLGEIVYELLSGTSGPSANPLKPGLLDFSPSNTNPMVLGTLDIPAGSALKNVKFTIEKVPSLCQNVEYAVSFNPGSGEKLITQNTVFKFDFGAEGRIVNPGETVTLYLGKIVDSMVARGSDLNNETIQTVDAGQAK